MQRCRVTSSAAARHKSVEAYNTHINVRKQKKMLKTPDDPGRLKEIVSRMQTAAHQPPRYSGQRCSLSNNITRREIKDSSSTFKPCKSTQ
jgi:hypothetical protein